MAQERCIKSTYAYSRLWLVGEVRTVSEYEDGGSPKASANFRLVQRDEVVCLDDVYDEEGLAEKKRESNIRDKRTSILRALDQLDHDNDAHWTRGGYPSVARVTELTGFETSRAMISAEAPDFERALRD